MRPQSLACREEVRIVRLASQVGHRGKEIHRPHGMPDYFALLADWSVRLVIAAELYSAQTVPPVVAITGARCRPSDGLQVEVVRLAAALVDKVFTQFEIASFT